MLNLEELTSELVDNIEELLDSLNLDYKRYPNKITLCCPIHEGDNPNGCTIFLDGQTLGNWCCWTHSCHLGNNTLLKFVCLVKKFKFQESVDYCLSLLGKNRNNFAVNEVNKDKKNFSRINRIFQDEQKEVVVPKIKLDELITPSIYYLKRGFSREVLTRFRVGFNNQKGELGYRVVVPVLEPNFVGAVGRTIQPKCLICDYHHYPNKRCPESQIEKLWGAKWANSRGFSKGNYLYNYENAKEAIQKSGKVILVEGQGDVWRCIESGYENTVGMFGVELTNNQEVLLEKSGALDIIVLTDNDEAGVNARKRIVERLSRTFNTHFLNLPVGRKDIGEMSIKETKNFLMNNI